MRSLYWDQVFQSKGGSTWSQEAAVVIAGNKIFFLQELLVQDHNVLFLIAVQLCFMGLSQSEIKDAYLRFPI